VDFANISRVKNPNAKLEQLRRSSLVEIEHMTKDAHPDPPLRALPEHSILEDEPTHPAGLSGGASPHGLDGAASHSSLSQPTAVTGSSRVGFAQSMGINDHSASQNSGNMTFKLPDFGQDNGSAAVAAGREDVLSPTQPKDEPPIPGAFNS
jgi:hypothetical protein